MDPVIVGVVVVALVVIAGGAVALRGKGGKQASGQDWDEVAELYRLEHNVIDKDSAVLQGNCRGMEVEITWMDVAHGNGRARITRQEFSFHKPAQQPFELHLRDRQTIIPDQPSSMKEVDLGDPSLHARFEMRADDPITLQSLFYSALTRQIVTSLFNDFPTLLLTQDKMIIEDAKVLSKDELRVRLDRLNQVVRRLEGSPEWTGQA